MSSWTRSYTLAQVNTGSYSCPAIYVTTVPPVSNGFVLDGDIGLGGNELLRSVTRQSGG